MFDLNSPIASFATFLKNYTDQIFYGITCTGKFFILPPENSVYSPIQNGSICNNTTDGNGVQSYSGIYVLTTGKNTAQLALPNPMDGNWYRTPVDNEPTYIENLNCILFASERERYDTYEKYGDVSKLIKAYASGIIPLMNSSYIAITSLNRDKQFWMVHDRTIDPLPVETDLTVKDLEKRYGIYPEILETHYVFIINTILRSSGKSKNAKETKCCTEIKKVEKSSIISGEPIIFANTGVVLFESQESGIKFLERYGVLNQYLVATALNATHKIHAQEIEELNQRVAKDKRGMVETWGIMGGSASLSILTENLIKSSVENDKEASKRAGKTFIIGVGALLSVVGIYKLYRWWEKKREERK